MVVVLGSIRIYERMMEMEILENIFLKKVVLKCNNKRNIEKLIYLVIEVVLVIIINF